MPVVASSCLFVLWLSPFAQESREQPQAGGDDPRSERPYWLGTLPTPIVGRPGTLPADASQAAIDWRYLSVSSKEWERWSEIENASDLQLKAELAASFLAEYPETLLAPNLHGVLAFFAHYTGDNSSFIAHAERLLESRPQLPDLLVELALVLVEEGMREEAIKRGRDAVGILNGLRRTAGIERAEWVERVFRLRSEANFALGMAYLINTPGQDDVAWHSALEMANTYLKLALHYRARHEGASFWLGYTQRNLGQAGAALLSFGRTVALNGSMSDHARIQIDEILSILSENDRTHSIREFTVEGAIEEARKNLFQDEERLRELRAKLAVRVETG